MHHITKIGNSSSPIQQYQIFAVVHLFLFLFPHKPRKCLQQWVDHPVERLDVTKNAFTVCHIKQQGGVSFVDAILTAATTGQNFDQLFSAFDC